jgi:hypothetical protein
LTPFKHVIVLNDGSHCSMRGANLLTACYNNG